MAPKAAGKDGAAKKSKEAERQAKEAAERQALAEATFVEADADESGFVDEQELAHLLATLLKKQSIQFEKNVLTEFVTKEFKDADTDGNGQVDGEDLTRLLGVWGACGEACPEDLDGDGNADGADLSILLGFWGPCAG